MNEKADAGLMSMTGFASTQGDYETWSWTADIRSVNGRGLDLRLRVPDWIEGLEPELRKLLQGRLARGNVTVNLRVTRSEESGGASLNQAGLDASLAVLSQIEAAAEKAGVTVAPPSVSDIAAMRGVVDFAEGGDTEDTKGLRQAVMSSLGACLNAFVDDRAREGKAIGVVLREQIERVADLTKDARMAAGERDVAARANMERALKRLLEVTEVPDEARMQQELALIAVKTDITEEIDRLGAHVEAARGLIAESGAVGRKLDFLMQEFNREANTLCSKSQSTALTSVGLDLKALIDQMREQVQNIE